MSENTKRTPLVNLALLLLLIGAIVKLGWSILAAISLPPIGVETSPWRHIGPLPRNFHLASNEALPKPNPTKAPNSNAIRGMKLQAIYRGPDHRLVVILKGTRSFIVARGENILGYQLKSVGDRSVVLTRNGKEYRLEIKKPSIKNHATLVDINPSDPASPAKTIRKEGSTTLVPRVIIKKYTDNPGALWKEIKVTPYKVKGQLRGFKVDSIQQGSVFQKLGLQRGDIIIAINGEPVKDYNTAARLYQTAKDLDALTLQVKRGDQEMELDYEVQ